MIKNFKHKGLNKYFVNNDKSMLNAKHCGRISRLLDRLDGSIQINDMDLPGYGLHKLLGDRKNTWSVTVSGNWRITFRFESGHAYDVNLEDYH